MDPIELGDGWIKSGRSFANINCVAVKKLSNGRIAVAHSGSLKGPQLTFSPEEFEAFLDGAEQFRHLI